MTSGPASGPSSIAVFVLVGMTLLMCACGAGEAERQATLHLENGINLYHQKALPQAEQALRQVLRSDLEDWRTFFYLGAIQIDLKRFEMAIPFLERALMLNPDEPKILNAMGVTYFKLGRLDMAKGYFWASLDLDPTNSNTRGLMETMAKLQRRAELAESSSAADPEAE